MAGGGGCLQDDLYIGWVLQKEILGEILDESMHVWRLDWRNPNRAGIIYHLGQCSNFEDRTTLLGICGCILMAAAMPFSSKHWMSPAGSLSRKPIDIDGTLIYYTLLLLDNRTTPF